MKNIPNLITGIVLWLYELGEIFFVPTITVEKMKKDGIKSFNPEKHNSYNFLKIPSVKKRIFMDSDYTCVLDYYKNLDKEEVN